MSNNVIMCPCGPLKQEFRAIGIKKLGFVLRLEKAAKKLPAMVIETKVPVRTPSLKHCGLSVTASLLRTILTIAII